MRAAPRACTPSFVALRSHASCLHRSEAGFSTRIAKPGPEDLDRPRVQAVDLEFRSLVGGETTEREAVVAVSTVSKTSSPANHPDTLSRPAGAEAVRRRDGAAQPQAAARIAAAVGKCRGDWTWYGRCLGRMPWQELDVRGRSGPRGSPAGAGGAPSPPSRRWRSAGRRFPAGECVREPT